jgi:(4S)-4-hydroxy-5-phosphonooxypentane-2,3-dione isomerase
MYVVSVTIWGKPEFQKQLLEATLDNAGNTRKHEPGNIRYDVSQKEDDPNRLHLFEVYKSKEDFAKHQQTEHYLRWKDKVVDWMAQPRVGVRHKAIFFGDDVV